MEKQYTQYKNALKQIYPQLSEKEWSYLYENTQRERYPRKEYFIEDGQIQRAIGFVVTGLIRGYYINEKGEEITIRFVKENGYVTHYSALLQQTPSKYTFQCLEDTEIIILPLKVIQKGYIQFAGLEKFGRLIAENILIHQQRRIESFQFLNAEQRYLKFIEAYPELFNRVSLSHLSTYLGIQRPSLSRIRKKIASP